MQEAGDAVGEKDLRVVLMQEAALVGNQREGGLSSEFSFKAFGGFFPQKIRVLRRLAICI